MIVEFPFSRQVFLIVNEERRELYTVVESPLAVFGCSHLLRPFRPFYTYQIIVKVLDFCFLRSLRLGHLWCKRDEFAPYLLQGLVRRARLLVNIFSQVEIEKVLSNTILVRDGTVFVFNYWFYFCLVFALSRTGDR